MKTRGRRTNAFLQVRVQYSYLVLQHTIATVPTSSVPRGKKMLRFACALNSRQRLVSVSVPASLATNERRERLLFSLEILPAGIEWRCLAFSQTR